MQCTDSRKISSKNITLYKIIAVELCQWPNAELYLRTEPKQALTTVTWRIQPLLLSSLIGILLMGVLTRGLQHCRALRRIVSPTVSTIYC